MHVCIKTYTEEVEKQLQYDEYRIVAIPLKTFKYYIKKKSLKCSMLVNMFCSRTVSKQQHPRQIFIFNIVWHLLGLANALLSFGIQLKLKLMQCRDTVQLSVITTQY